MIGDVWSLGRYVTKVMCVCLFCAMVLYCTFYIVTDQAQNRLLWRLLVTNSATHS